MIELLRSADIATITSAQAYLKAEDIPCVLFDRNMSILEGSIGMLIPQRLMVAETDYERARELLILAGVLDES